MSDTLDEHVEGLRTEIRSLAALVDQLDRALINAETAAAK